MKKKTTLIRIDIDLKKRLKLEAVKKGITMRELLSEKLK